MQTIKQFSKNNKIQLNIKINNFHICKQLEDIMLEKITFLITVKH